MTPKEKQIKQVEQDIKELEAIIQYVELNKHKEWCWEIDIRSCQSKIRFYKASLNDTVRALKVDDHEEALDDRPPSWS